MQKDFTLQKRFILVVLGLLVAADIGMGVYSWQLSNAPRTPQKEFDEEYVKLKVLKGDIQSAQLIKDNMPTTRKDCEKFEQSLPSASVGYSSVTSELDDVAKKSGLQIVTLTDHQKDLPQRSMAEVSIDATVSGDYGSVVRFVNGLQRSQKFYIVDGLALASDTQNQSANGPIRVGIHLRTYFRMAS